MRVGIGYDVHPFAADRPLVLGGVTVPHTSGLQGHSDGDVLTHALIDALLGAAALGDIGTHFPSEDEQWRGASSVNLLAKTRVILAEAGFGVANVDATIVAQAPKLAPHTQAMRELLAQALAVDPSTVSVKATTTDRLGAIGRDEGIAAVAVALIDST
ncbi:MAG: 2-C-methyl-D-erythritol 2,4-cyclodiphosphate synthase [Chloroflexi bacterium]|nr:2-C-methyl-D-erythritol 2,4-cyclodiphosphate synthase [Chloroflexota bacterium]MCI0889887.1 2-C-methyl-D-erythritol 2,4-cyclodiphosphate synthase [Chloroflexota bacterium]